MKKYCLVGFLLFGAKLLCAQSAYKYHVKEVSKSNVLLRDSAGSVEIARLPFPGMVIIFSDSIRQIPKFRDNERKAYYIDGLQKIKWKK